MNNDGLIHGIPNTAGGDGGEVEYPLEVKYTTKNTSLPQWCYQAKAEAMVKDADFAVLALCDSTANDPENCSFKLVKEKRDAEWEKRFRYYTRIARACALLLFPNCFKRRPPAFDIAFLSCRKYNYNKAKLESTRLSYSKRHCKCPYHITISHLMKGRLGRKGGTGKIPSSCKTNFDLLGNGWYVTSINDMHDGCIPTNTTHLSEEEEQIITELLMSGHSVGTPMSNTISLIHEQVGITIDTKLA